jgi:hypothetical protein
MEKVRFEVVSAPPDGGYEERWGWCRTIDEARALVYDLEKLQHRSERKLQFYIYKMTLLEED